MPKRLTKNEIEPKPKRILDYKNFRMARTREGDLDWAALDLERLKIMRKIERGEPLERWRYRRSTETAKQDYALKNYGFMHLHLTEKHGNQLLWLVQYDDAVVFLEVTDHATFSAWPPGSTIDSFHRKILADLERAADERVMIALMQQMLKETDGEGD